MATTIDISSEYLDDIYEGTEVAIGEDGYALLLIRWSGLGVGNLTYEGGGAPIIKNCVPEILVQQADDEYQNWYPIYQQRNTYEEPVKFRLNDNSGSYSINIYPLLEGTFVRIKINFNGVKEGTIIYNFEVGS